MSTEQALLIEVNQFKTITELHVIEAKLRNRINKKLGEFDNHSIGLDLSDCTIYMYGPSTDKLYDGVKNIIENEKALNGTIAILRYGETDSNCEEKRITIKAS